MFNLLKQILIENIVAAALTLVAITLLIVSFLIPPVGEIPPSALQGASIIMGFTAIWTTIVQLYRGKKASFTHDNTTISVEDNK